MKITKVKSTLSGKMIADGKPEGSVPLLVIQHEDGDGEVDVEGEGGRKGGNWKFRDNLLFRIPRLRSPISIPGSSNSYSGFH
jgi:hypothetical protein